MVSYSYVESLAMLKLLATCYGSCATNVLPYFSRRHSSHDNKEWRRTILGPQSGSFPTLGEGNEKVEPPEIVISSGDFIDHCTVEVPQSASPPLDPRPSIETATSVKASGGEANHPNQKGSPLKIRFDFKGRGSTTEPSTPSRSTEPDRHSSCDARDSRGGSKIRGQSATFSSGDEEQLSIGTTDTMSRQRSSSVFSSLAATDCLAWSGALASNEEREVPGYINVMVQYSDQKELLILTVVDIHATVAVAAGKELPLHFSTQDQLECTVIRLRVYRRARGKFSANPASLITGRSETLIGEAFFQTHHLSGTDAQTPTHHRLQLKEPKMSSLLLESQQLAANKSPSSSSSAAASPKLPPFLAMNRASIDPRHQVHKNSCPNSLPSPSLGVRSFTEGGNHLPPSSSSSMFSMGGGGVAMPSIAPTSASASRRSSMVDSVGRFCALPQAVGNPELLISLCYLENQSKMVVGVERANGLDSMLPINSPPMSPYATSPTSPGHKAPDTFVRVAALSAAGVELSKHKSAVVKGANDPIYNDTSVFEVGSRSELEQLSILIRIYTYAGMFNRKKVQLGWICVGSSEAGHASSADAQQHWQDMIQGNGISVDKWHNVLRPPLISK